MAQRTYISDMNSVLGARKLESETRTQTMGKYEIADFKLRKHQTISGAYVYTPIEDLEVDAVWDDLLHVPSPWGITIRNYRSCTRRLTKKLLLRSIKALLPVVTVVLDVGSVQQIGTLCQPSISAICKRSG